MLSVTPPHRYGESEMSSIIRAWSLIRHFGRISCASPTTGKNDHSIQYIFYRWKFFRVHVNRTLCSEMTKYRPPFTTTILLYPSNRVSRGKYIFNFDTFNGFGHICMEPVDLYIWYGFVIEWFWDRICMETLWINLICHNLWLISHISWLISSPGPKSGYQTPPYGWFVRKFEFKCRFKVFDDVRNVSS